MTNQAVQEALNLQVANWSVLYTKLHHYHWYVKGHHFYTLHEKFEQLYTAAAKYMDDTAERLLAIHGKPVSTMKEQLAMATIQEASGGGSESAEQMVKELADDLSAIALQLADGIEAASEAHDDPTADLFTSIRSDIEKHNWMLHAYLG
ncbi:DNA starvation/stationary phase protection protein [Paenibacillus protaetiae]|uniref:DNA starvation/stationary phase protection protein n=2 Tax=Paenibacillus protaetiae TaxID=2509456 RepID=A0A4P6F0L9_9BACL|nr:DNA starvation/stationary phase protection protein [Paenibacillus protaetiae]